MNRRLAYGRLGLALALPLLVAGLIGALLWHAAQQRHAAAATEQTVQAAIQALRQRQAEYRPGGSGYQRYVGLLNDGFAAPATPAELRKLIGRLARQHEVTVQAVEIGEPAVETAAAGLALTHQPVIVTASAAGDAALLAFIDAMRRSGQAELELEMLTLKAGPAALAGTIGFAWHSLQGAPQLEYSETPVELADALAPGGSLFGPGAGNPAATPAPMLLTVEDARP